MHTIRRYEQFPRPYQKKWPLWTGLPYPVGWAHDHNTGIRARVQNQSTMSHAVYLSTVVAMHVTSIDQFFKKMMSVTNQQAKTTRLIMNLIIIDLRPVNIADGTAFTELISHAYLDYPLALNHYYTDRINDLYAVESNKPI